MDTLLLLSGGIDSAFCLWQRASQGLPTRVHHVNLSDHEGREAVEYLATQDILLWMRENTTGVIEYSESSVDFGNMWIPKNFHLWAYWAGTIIASPNGQGIQKVILPRHFDAFPGGPDSPSAKKSDRVYLGHIELMANRTVQLEYPIVGMMKADVIRSMPRELLELCWYCRTPQMGKPCHGCPTCKLVRPVLKELENASV